MQKFKLEISGNNVHSIKLSFLVISDPSKVLESSEELDAFINKWSKNPFLLSGYLNQFMISSRTSGWTPILLIIKANEEIVGIAPLTMKERLGIRFVKFLPKDTFSPDFVFNDLYQEVSIKCIFEYFFKTLNCQCVGFYLPVESSNYKKIENLCKFYGIDCSIYTNETNSIIPVESSWDLFQQKKGRRRIIRQIESKLDQLGPWKIEYIENACCNSEVLEKMLDVERRSWKASQPAVLSVTQEELSMVWKGSKVLTKTEKDIKSSVWFLKIDNEIIAYTFVIRHKGGAFIPKTSYDERYRKSYVGKYINNIAIRDMFNEAQIKNIDFMSAFPFMSFWSSTSLNYVGVLIWNGNFGKLLKSFRSMTLVPKGLEVVINKLPAKQKELFESKFATFATSV